MISRKVVHQTKAILPVVLISIMVGVGYGWIAPILQQSKDSTSGTGLSFTLDQCSWIASLHYVTRTIAPFMTAGIIHKTGCNPVFVIIACILFLMWIAVYAFKTVYAHYVIRLVFGIAIGIYQAICNIYIGENSSPRIRGVFSSINNACFFIGELISYILAEYLSYNCVAIVQAIMGFTVLLSMILLKESPQFLIMKGNVEKAERNYNYLRNLTGECKQPEFEEIKQYVQEEQSKTGNLLSQLWQTPEARKSVRVVICCYILSMATGFAAINAFITMFFSESSSVSPNQFTIFLGTLQAIGCCLSSYFVEKFNRRPLLLFSVVIIAITHLGTIILYILQKSWNLPFFDWFLFITETVYSCVFAMLTSPVVMAISGEILPQNIKGIASSLTVAIGSLMNFLSTQTFWLVAKNYGIEMNFILFFLFSLVMLIHVYFDLPETRGKTLVEIQKELKMHCRAYAGVPFEDTKMARV